MRGVPLFSLFNPAIPAKAGIQKARGLAIGRGCQNQDFQDFQDWRDFQDFDFARLALFAITVIPPSRMGMSA